MSDGDFKLDTKNMDEAASLCEKLADKMKGLKQELDNAKTSAVSPFLTFLITILLRSEKYRIAY